MSHLLWLCLAFILTIIASPAQAQERAEAFSRLIAQDLRLAGIAERLLVANDALCTSRMPVTGLVLHSADQYAKPLPGEPFAWGDVGIAAIVPGSPADEAGLKAGDALAVVGGERLSDLPREGEGPLRDRVFDVLARQPAEAPLRLELVRDGQLVAADLQPSSGCLALVEIITEAGRNARSNGRVIQVKYGLAAYLTDDALAAIFAHELAHSVLHHRRRLSAEGVSKGLAGQFGRDQQLNRQAEVEADRLSAHLLANAGYDPAIAASFWASETALRMGSHSFVHPSPASRSTLLSREIADYLPLRRGFSWPGHLLALRDRPFPAD